MIRTLPRFSYDSGLYHLVDLRSGTAGYSPGTEVLADDACAPHAAEKSEALDTADPFAFLLPSLSVRLTL
jgi:hypothetical protein